MRRARRLNRPGLPGSSESAVLLSNDLQAEATLNLDFRSGVLDPRIDFQRTTTGTYYRGPFNQNLFRHSQDYTQAVWGGFASGTGSLPVITANAAVAPNGTMTANRVVMDRGNGTTTSDRSLVLSIQGLSIVANAPYTLSVWMRGTVGGEVVTIRNAATTDVTVTLTTAWQRFSFTANALNSNPSMWVCGNVATTSALQVITIEVWGAQLTEGSLLTPYIPTTTAAITQGQIAAAEPWNLCIRSEEVNLWPTLLGATVTSNAIVAPDGNTTADMVVEDTSTGQHRVLVGNQALGGTVDSSVYSVSVYLKAGTRSRAQVFDNAQSPSGATFFDLSAGTVLSGTGTIVDAGNGWWRCTVFPAKTSATNSNPAVSLVSSGTTTNYTGDGTSGLYVWGLQINLGTSALPYRSTTTAALWLPRFENDPITGAARGLLIEGGATNLQLYSADITNGTVRVNVTVGATKITAPDGTASGELVSATTTAVTTLRTGTATISGTTVTSSMFVKKGSLDTIAFRMLDTVAASFVLESEYTFSTNTTTVTSGTGTLTATNVGNGWIRLALTATAWTAGNGLRTFIHFTGATATTGDSLYVWGVQVEAQSFASSYIPTTTATVARGAESALMTGTNFSSWYNQAEGTIFSSWQGLPLGAPFGVCFPMSIDNGTINERHVMITGGQASTSVLAVTTDSVNQCVLNFTSQNGLLPGRCAYAYQVDNFAASYNGLSALTDLTGTMPTPNLLRVGGAVGAGTFPANTCISRLAYWPTRLPNETLQALTT